MPGSRKGTHSSPTRQAPRTQRPSTRSRARLDAYGRPSRASRIEGSHSRSAKRGASSLTIAMAALGALAIIAVLVFAGAWFADFNKKNSARNELTAQVDEVIRVDKVLLSLDESINSKTTVETIGESQAALTQIPVAQDSLAKTKLKLAEIRPKLRADDRALADAVGKSIEGREQMLTTGENIVSLDTSAAVALKLVDEGWAKMLEAHEKSDKATENANKETRSGFKASLELNQEAKGELAEAKKDFEEVQSMFPAADLGKFMSYINGRIKANGFAIAGDKATLTGDLAKANSAIKKLNDQNRKSAKQLAKLPKTPGEALSEQYRLQAAELLAQYDQAKKDTAQIDENVRKLM